MALRGHGANYVTLLSGRLPVDVIERIDGRRFGIVFLGPNHTVVDRLRLLLEQILEDEPAPNAAAGVHQRATLVELSQLDGGEAESFGQIRHGSGRVLVVARQEDDPVAALDARIGRQLGRAQMIEPFYELGAGEGLRDEGGGREAVQLFKEVDMKSAPGPVRASRTDRRSDRSRP